MLWPESVPHGPGETDRLAAGCDHPPIEAFQYSRLHGAMAIGTGSTDDDHKGPIRGSRDKAAASHLPQAGGKCSQRRLARRIFEDPANPADIVELDDKNCEAAACRQFSQVPEQSVAVGQIGQLVVIDDPHCCSLKFLALSDFRAEPPLQRCDQAKRRQSGEGNAQNSIVKSWKPVKNYVLTDPVREVETNGRQPHRRAT
nr:hypothetical protein [Consotaella salsifontis]